MTPQQRELIQLLVDSQVLRFGDFVLKSGKHSKYFLNLGLVDDGASLGRLVRFYAKKIVEDIGADAFDVLFGPAYKGIPLAAAIAMCLASEFDLNKPFAYDRKQAKDHAEGGRLVGGALTGGVRALVIDDVFSHGTAKLEAIDLLRAEAGAQAVGVLVCADRMEPADDGLTQAEQFTRQTSLPVHSLISRADIETFVGHSLDT